MKYLFILLLSLYFITGCSFSGKKYSIKIDSLQVYGDNGKNLMAAPAYYHYRNGKIYIWDIILNKMFIYSIDGKIIKQIQLREGQGPGEVSKYYTVFDVISDSTLVFLVKGENRVQFISTNGNYLREFHVQLPSTQIHYRDSLLYLSVEDVNTLISVYTFEGKKVNSLIKPFTTKHKQLLLPFVDVEDDLSIYFANGIKTEISKWQNGTIQWKFSDEKLGLLTQSSNDDFSKGWLSLFVYKNYFIASTYNSNTKKKGRIKPKMLLLDKNTGKLLYTMNMKWFYVKSFENNKYIFMRLNDPYPHLERIDIKIVKE